MSLEAGQRIGPFEIAGPLGAGGMGEVYRARDTRLGREVAVKVLPPEYATDPERLARFQLEARATGLLNDSNILTVYDVGTHDGAPYVVEELVEGESLRERLERGPLPVRRAVDVAAQVARGLAAAHERGIVHRDLKPENVMIARDGRVKILDFGLAKLTGADEGDGVGGSSAVKTRTGMVVGSVGYMSPEQVRGDRVDPRSDLFALGTILYEMLAGQRAFRRPTPVETLNAILKEEPPELADLREVSLPLARIVRHCLEKDPDRRFQSARDLAFQLEALLVEGSSPVRTRSFLRLRAPGRRTAALLLAALALAATFWAGTRLGGAREAPAPEFRPLTFRRGAILSGRFAPDGRSVTYGAAWGASEAELFTIPLDSTESRPLGVTRARVVGVLPGEVAVLQLDSEDPEGGGTLARVPLGGGSPREVLEDVLAADLSPDGSTFAVVRSVAGRQRIEYPPGKVLYESAGEVDDVRISPDGARVAFVDRPIVQEYGGNVVVVDRSGRAEALSSGWPALIGLAFSPDGEEVWVTAARRGTSFALVALGRGGKERVLLRVPGALLLHDVSRDGKVLVAHAHFRLEAFGRPPGETRERDLSWLDVTRIDDVSPDGRTILFDETGEGAGERYSVYLRRSDGSPPVRLGDGSGLGLSPDGSWALALDPVPPSKLLLHPTGPGESRTLPRGSISEHQRAWWLPDGKALVVLGNEAGRAQRLFLQELPAGLPDPVSPEGTGSLDGAVSPDGSRIVTRGPDGVFRLFPLDRGEPRPVPGLLPGDRPVGFAADGRGLFVRSGSFGPLVRIDRLDLGSGARTTWGEVRPSDPAGVLFIGRVLLTPSGEGLFYQFERLLGDLFVVEGVR
ncbi:MAG: serine/threonine protein kinase [Acidobacteria bacterium]|nr:MAG: serine/threonine protein kinase [Acidobacteriota bacterium]MCE7956926.1 serine/threonine protein kinase [Acidobacteria bacterium ACB2]